MRQQHGADLPERAHVVGAAVPAMRLLAGEGFGQEHLVRMIRHRHQLDIEALALQAALLQMVPRGGEIVVPPPRLRGEHPDDKFHPLPDRQLARPQTPTHQRMIAFCTCSRFSASSKTTECGPSITAFVTSSSRCAGRQCMKSASGFAAAITASFTW